MLDKNDEKTIGKILKKVIWQAFIEAWNMKCDLGWEYPNGKKRIEFLRREDELKRS